MTLTFKPFDPPTRPFRFQIWSVANWWGYVLMVALAAAATETWWAVLLVGYVLVVLVCFRVREWRWSWYADDVEATFVEIGQAADAISTQVRALVEQVEERSASAVVDPPGSMSITVETSTTHDVRYWVSSSKGQH